MEFMYNNYTNLILGNIGSGYHERKKIRKEHFSRTWKFFKTKLCGKNLIKEINI